MSQLQTALRAISDAPSGPHVGAFFDLDGTLVRGYTALAFVRDHIARRELSPRELMVLGQDLLAYLHDPSTGRRTVARGVALLSGRSVAELEERGSWIFRKQIARALRLEGRALVEAHQRAGHTVVLATAATPFQAWPVARDLGVEHVLSTEVEVVDGALTGKLLGPPRWGSGKAEAVAGFAAKHAIDCGVSFAYGNGAEDWDFLNLVGHPTAICPDKTLARRAHAQGMPVVELADPPEPGLRGVAGTVGALGVFNAGIIATVGGSFLADRRAALRVAAGPTADFALAAAGVTLKVQGRHHVERARPAVVVFNHQSNLDPIVVASLLRYDFTGVGKAEIRDDPRGLFVEHLGIALIDRSNAEEARASVAALVDRIRAGESVLIAPEGTRMPTPRLGRFKKGAFHLAMNAGVPMLPVVIRNSGAHWPPGTTFIRPGQIEVCVLPPVETTDWRAETLNTHVEQVRDLFEATLRGWPEDAAP